MSHRLAGMLLVLSAAVAAAQEPLPALHDVTGIPASDMLEIHALPDDTSPVIGTLSHDATAIEGILQSDDASWVMVNHGDRAGWVERSALERQPGQSSRGFLEVRQCLGTEPFWSLGIDERARATWSAPGKPVRTGAMPGVFKSANNRTVEGFTLVFRDDSRVYAILRRGLCSDGMSDRAYGIAVDLFLTQENGRSQLLSGCCSLRSASGIK